MHSETAFVSMAWKWIPVKLAHTGKPRVTVQRQVDLKEQNLDDYEDDEILGDDKMKTKWRTDLRTLFIQNLLQDTVWLSHSWSEDIK